MSRVDRRSGAALRAAVIAAVIAAAGTAVAGAAQATGPAVPQPSAHISAADVTRTGSHETLHVGVSVAGAATVVPGAVSVSVDGHPVPAQVSIAAAGGTAPVVHEVYLVLDTSGSMAGAGIAAARAAALSYARALPPEVRVGVVAFADRPRVLLAATADRAALARAIAGLQAGGGTALYDGIVTAADAMAALPADSQRRILVLSDGVDTVSRAGVADALAALSAHGIDADVVAFRLGATDETVLHRIASSAHGSLLPAAGTADLASAFAAAADRFRARVDVTATLPEPAAGSTTGSTATVHSVTVTVREDGRTLSATTQVTAPAAPATPAVPAAPGAARTPVTATVATASPHNRSLWLVLAVSFVALLGLMLLALFVPVMNRRHARKQARLAELHRYRVLGALGAADPEAAAGPTTTAVTRTVLGVVDRAVRSRGRRERLVDELDRSGLRLAPEEWAVVQLASVLVPAVVLGLLTASPIGGLVGAAAGLAAVRAFLARRIRQRREAFAAQLPETLQFLAGSLRSGFALHQALGGVVAEGVQPSAGEFARALAEVRLGSSLDDALDAVADRTDCDDLRWVVLAIRVSREIGGNLAEVLGTTVDTMRQRAELRGQIRVLSAEGRLSARILLGLPFLLAGFLLVFRRGYLDPLVHTAAGAGMLAAGAVLLTLGALWLAKLVRIEV